VAPRRAAVARRRRKNKCTGTVRRQLPAGYRAASDPSGRPPVRIDRPEAKSCRVVGFINWSAPRCDPLSGGDATPGAWHNGCTGKFPC